MSIDSIDIQLLNESIDSLIKYTEKQHKQKQHSSSKISLIEDLPSSIQLQIQLNHEIKKAVQRPVRVKIPHSLYFPDILEDSICLFCKTDDKKDVEEQVEKNPIAGLSKVLSITDVVKLFKVFQERKQLKSQHSHFLCDSRIMTQLYNALGTTFNHVNVMPIPIDMANVSKLSSAVNKAVKSSTYMHLKGKNITFRIGYMHMAVEEISANIIEGLKFCVEKISGGWSNVHSIHIKTNDSPSMPVYGKAANEAMNVLRATAATMRSQVAAANTSSKKAKPAATAATVAESQPTTTGKRTRSESNQEKEKATKPGKVAKKVKA